MGELFYKKNCVCVCFSVCLLLRVCRILWILVDIGYLDIYESFILILRIILFNIKSVMFILLKFFNFIFIIVCVCSG